MNNLENYISFCKIFHKYKFPKIKFKEFDKRYEFIYQKEFDVNENDVNKASFFIFLFAFLTLVLFSIFLLYFDILIVLFYSLILSLVISYKFNLILYHIIKKKELKIDAMLYLIKVDFSLIQKSLNSNSDYCLNFIILLKSYNFPLSESFKAVLRRIHEGSNPESELNKIITPSKEFNKYLKNLLVNDFDYNHDNELLEQGSSERKFKVFLRDIESKISIIFFIGLFFPIGLCFIVLFQQIEPIMMIFFIPIFLFSLNYLFRKFIKVDFLLIGFLKDFSRNEKKRFDEFLHFLKVFGTNLKSKVSPEKAFFNSYSKNKNKINFLRKSLLTQLTCLTNSSSSFNEALNSLKLELHSIRYRLILDAIEKIIEKNSYYSHEKILDILAFINKHRSLEKKLDIIIKGEKFKVFFFFFLLPIIIGAISGLFPFFDLITNDLNLNNDISFHSYDCVTNFFEILIIFLTLLLSNLITSYYFLKIINYEKPFFLIFITSMLFTLSFFISFLNVVNFL